MQSRWIFPVFILFLSITAYAQSTDSLKVMAREAVGKPKLKHYQKIALRYYGKQQYDSARKYFGLMAELSLQTGQLKLAGEGFNNLGAISNHLSDFKGAIESYRRSIEAFKAMGDSVKMAAAYTNLGLAFKGLNVYDRAFENLMRAARTFEDIDSISYLASSYSAIGNIHREVGDMSRSYNYLERALILRESVNDSSGIAYSLHNLGIWNFENSNIEKSLELLNKALSYKALLKNDLSSAFTLTQLGDVYSSLNDEARAQQYYSDALATRKRFGDDAGIAVVSNRLAKLYLEQGNIQKALSLSILALENARSNAKLKEQVLSLETLYSLYTKGKNYEKAVHVAEELLEVKDAILDKEKARYLMESEVKFEVYEKDKEISSQQLQVITLENRSQRLLLMVLGLGLIIVVVTLLLQVARKIAKERKTAKERVERLLNELNHRTKNHLQAQSGLIKQQMLKLKDEPAKELIKDIDNQIKAINLIHQSLYASTEDSLETINLTSYVQNIVENLMISFGMTRNQIRLSLELDELDIDVHRAMPIGLILNESVTNAFKHAFVDVAQPELSVKLKRDESDSISLMVVDNGIGFDDEGVARGAGGLSIMKSLAEELGGEMVFMNENNGMVLLKFRATS